MRSNGVSCFKPQVSGYTQIMGIINLTPDSFSGDGLYHNIEAALQRAEAMVHDGADIIDIGGESSRPGSEPVSEAEERRRVIPFLRKLRKRISIPISIDTCKPRVADAAMEAGADIINDISGLQPDGGMMDVVVRRKAQIVLMHMKGVPRDMQLQPHYNDVVKEVFTFLDSCAKLAIDHGIDRNNIVIDPGIGFGKSVQHNLALLNNLNEFNKLGFPVMVGVSRKSFIGATLGNQPDNRLTGSLAAAAIAVSHGASVLRVHDVKETIETVKVCKAILNS